MLRFLFLHPYKTLFPFFRYGCILANLFPASSLTFAAANSAALFPFPQNLLTLFLFTLNSHGSLITGSIGN